MEKWNGVERRKNNIGAINARLVGINHRLTERLIARRDQLNASRLKTGKLENEIAQLNHQLVEASRALATTDEKHTQYCEQLLLKHANERAQMQQEHEKELAGIRNASADEIARLTEAHEIEKTELAEWHDRETQRVRVSYEETIRKLEGQIGEYEEYLASLEAKIREKAALIEQLQTTASMNELNFSDALVELRSQKDAEKAKALAELNQRLHLQFADRERHSELVLRTTEAGYKAMVVDLEEEIAITRRKLDSYTVGFARFVGPAFVDLYHDRIAPKLKAAYHTTTFALQRLRERCEDLIHTLLDHPRYRTAVAGVISLLFIGVVASIALVTVPNGVEIKIKDAQSPAIAQTQERHRAPTYWRDTTTTNKPEVVREPTDRPDPKSKKEELFDELIQMRPDTDHVFYATPQLCEAYYAKHGTHTGVECVSEGEEVEKIRRFEAKFNQLIGNETFAVSKVPVTQWKHYGKLAYHDTLNVQHLFGANADGGWGEKTNQAIKDGLSHFLDVVQHASN